jgi:hypothetical protein
MAKEVIEKQCAYETAFRWFYSQKKAEEFCIRKMKTGLLDGSGLR